MICIYYIHRPPHIFREQDTTATNKENNRTTNNTTTSRRGGIINGKKNRDKRTEGSREGEGSLSSPPLPVCLEKQENRMRITFRRGQLQEHAANKSSP